MSWMDSWSRPSKSQATPPPLYLTAGDSVPYCHSCGRVIGQRKSQAGNEVKYCSTRCRHNKPGPLDRRIEAAFAALLDGASADAVKGDIAGHSSDGDEQEKHGDRSNGFRRKGDDADAKSKKGKKKKHVKGDPRITVECGYVEDLLFPRHKDPEKVFGRRKNRKARGIIEKPEDWRSVDMVDDPEPQTATGTVTASNASRMSVTSSTHDTDDRHTTSDEESDSEGSGGIALESRVPPDPAPNFGFGSGKIRPPQEQSEVNGAIGGEKGWAERIDETDEMKLKRREGQKRADEREMVRKAARRLCAFGVPGDGEEDRRKCEAVMKGVVVEGSFAKGEWGIRWREKV